MHKLERKNMLLDFLQAKPFHNMAEINEYVESLGIAYVTVRRDLKELQNEGLVSLSYGGVKTNEKSDNSTIKHLNQLNLNLTAKQQIAKLAQKLINQGDVLYLGAGTTCEEFAKQIKTEVKVITNSWFVYQILLKNSYIIEPILVGGKYREPSGVFIGSFAEKALEIEPFYKTFVSVTNIDYDGNLYNSNEGESHLEAIILAKAKYKYILADSSKFNSMGYEHFCNIKDIDGIITDRVVEIKSEYLAKIIN
ncbi:DeoR/GlpR family DNA-binding transcription regulator [Spiroplasma sp. DGKH1]|uniref:DeoR/GlpR family DNA-binding transcription regulator n=1 Tax=Spiroplasma sp. DGKH1 TaxID=3050074 RepID=UPI0034C69241